jgi:hypothetical protein
VGNELLYRYKGSDVGGVILYWEGEGGFFKKALGILGDTTVSNFSS